MIRMIHWPAEPLPPREAAAAPDISADVAAILAEVRQRGDAALREFTKRFDGAEPESLEISRTEMECIAASVDAEFLRILRRAAENIRAFHEKQRHEGFELRREDGVVLGQRVRPLERVGLYIPGGTACYPSSVLMNCIPAKIAGVGELVLVTPPRKDGSISADILAAALIGGADRVFRIGGAQAVAALAFGTESVPRVDKITGPGNAYVAEAKRQVFGQVAIDMIAGPSEILIVADENNDPAILAADLLSQAEHDKNAAAILATPSRTLAEAVREELEQQLAELPRAEIARTSIDKNGCIVLTESIQTAVEVSNLLAPEHLELCVDEPFRYLDKVRAAGSVFLGKSCPESLGDYMAGPNHVLPTGGSARFSSALGVEDFLVRSQYSFFPPEAFAALAGDVAVFAGREGLHAHARAATIRLEKTEKEREGA